MALLRHRRARHDGALRALPPRLHHLGLLRRGDAHHRPSLAVAAGGDVDLLHPRHLHRRRRRDAARRPSLSDGDHRGDERPHAPHRRDLQPHRHPLRLGCDAVVRRHQLPARLRQLPHAVDDADLDALFGDPDLRLRRRALHRGAAHQRLAPRLRGSEADAILVPGTSGPPS